MRFSIGARQVWHMPASGGVAIDDLFNFILGLQSWPKYFRRVKIPGSWNTTGLNGTIRLAPQFDRFSINMLDWTKKPQFWIVCAFACDSDVTMLTLHFSCHLDFTSGAEMWLDEYEDSTFEQQLENIFEEIRPLYQQLHAYVRHALRAKYGDLVTETGPIPMHLLGNMWAQSWDSVRAWQIRFKLWNHIHSLHCSQIAKFTAPFPGKGSADVTDEMIRQNYTALKMFQMGDQFFQSLNFTALPE